MLNSKILLIILLIGMMTVVNSVHAQAGHGIAPGLDIPTHEVVGAWHIDAVRPGSLALRPTILTYKDDGTFTYRSSSNLSTIATNSDGSGGQLYFGRSSASGTWERIADHLYQSSSEEFLYGADGRTVGRFMVVIRTQVNGANDSAQDTVTGQFKFAITQYKFAQNSDGSGTCDTLNNRNNKICGEVIRLSDTIVGTPSQFTGYRVSASCFFNNEPGNPPADCSIFQDIEPFPNPFPNLF